MSTTAQIQEIYVGLLGRAADADGLAYWTAEIDGGVLSIEQLRANIVNEQAEYAANLGSLARADLVEELYQNLFNRSTDAEGLEYWTNGGGASVNADQLVLALSDGASTADRIVLNNRTEVATYYTNSGVDYTSAGAANAIADVDGTDSSVAAAKTDIGLLASPVTASLTSADQAANFSAGGPVTVTIDGSDDATDGDDFVVTGSKFNDTFSVVEFRELTIAGGDGVDTLDMSDDDAVVNALTGRANYAGNTTNIAEFTGIEKFVFDRGGDDFTGGAASETIVGAGGDDELSGGAGDDTFVIVDTEQLEEITTTALAGGIGTDTLEIGVLRTTNGYTVDTTTATGVADLDGSSIERLVVTGKSDRDGDQVFASTITVENSESDFTKFVGATTKDKLVVEDAGGALNMSSWTFSNIAEVETNLGAAALTLKQKQLDSVGRWTTEADDTLALAVNTGVSAATFDLTKNYFNGFLAVTEAADIKTTYVVNQAALSGFLNTANFDLATITLTNNDTLQVSGDADLSESIFGATAATLVIDGHVILSADSAGNDTQTDAFDEVVASADSVLEVIADTAAAGLDLAGYKFDGLKSLVITGSAANGAVSLDATTTGIDGLEITTAGEVTFDATGKLPTADYQTFDGLTLSGSNVTGVIDGEISLDQATISGLKILEAVTAGDNLWVVGDLDLSSITDNDNGGNAVTVQDTSVDNDIIGMSDAATYTFSKGGVDTFTSMGKNDDLDIEATAGSVTATMGNGTNTLDVTKTTGTATAVTATFGASGDHTATINSTSSGAIDLTFETYTTAKIAGPQATVVFDGKGAQTATFGDIQAGSGTTTIDLDGKGAMTVVGGNGVFNIDMAENSTATGTATITLGDGESLITADQDSFSGNVAITVGANVDDSGDGTKDGAIVLTETTGVNTITTGKGGWAVTGGAGQDTITTGSGNDTITLSAGGDVINLSGGGYDDIVAHDGVDFIAGDHQVSFTGVADGHAASFTGYTTINDIAVTSTAATSDQIQVTAAAGGVTFDSIAGGLAAADAADLVVATDLTSDLVLLTTGTADLTDVDGVVDTIGAATWAGETILFVINDTDGESFGLYQVVDGSAAGFGDDIDVAADLGVTAELVLIGNGNITADNITDFFV